MKRPASVAFLSKLRTIASALRYIDNDVASNLAVDAKRVRELGALLMRISNGEDARRLFRQDERSKPSREREHHNVALAYWATFAIAHDRDAAIAAARKITPTLSKRSILDIKGRHRRRSLRMLNVDGRATFEQIAGVEIKAPTRQQYAALTAYLRKKRKHSRDPV